MRARCPRGPFNPPRHPVLAQSDHHQFICCHYPPSDTRHSPPLCPCGPIPPPPPHPEGQRPAVSLWLHAFGTQWGVKQTNQNTHKKPHRRSVKERWECDKLEATWDGNTLLSWIHRVLCRKPRESGSSSPSRPDSDWGKCICPGSLTQGWKYFCHNIIEALSLLRY